MNGDHLRKSVWDKQKKLFPGKKQSHFFLTLRSFFRSSDLLKFNMLGLMVFFFESLLFLHKQLTFYGEYLANPKYK